jgi:integrase
MRKVLTDALIRAYPKPTNGRVELADVRCVGLSFRITSQSARSWSFRFRDRVSGKIGRFTIGRYPDIGLSAARAKADQLRGDVAGGINPAERKRQTRAEAPTKTFRALASRYLAEHARRKKRSHAVDDRNLRLHILPTWGDRAYAGITRGNVIELVEKLVTAGKPIMANRVQSLVSTIFGFAIDAGLVTANPCSRLRKRGQENVGHRVLSDDEIRLFWSQCEGSVVYRSVSLALRLALLTGCRVGEIAGLARDELEHLHDDQRAAWLVPIERVKNKRAHLVPLSGMARGIISELLAAISPQDQALLPARAGIGSIRGHSLTNAVIRIGERIEGDAEAASTWKADPPTAHDLRRTVETRLSSLGIPKEDRDAVLNHVRSDVGSRHYDRYDRAAEKRRALNLWAAVLEGILSHRSAQVVPLTHARVRCDPPISAGDYMKKRSAVKELDSGNGNGPRRSREQRLALYAKIKGDTVAEFRARQQQYRDWIAVAEIEDRMRERRGDFDRKGQIPGTLQSILRNAARGDYGDRTLLWVEPRRSNFGRRWLVRPEAAPDSAFVSKDMIGHWQFHGEDDVIAYLISHCWVPRTIAIEWLRADGIEPPLNWKPTAAEVCGAIEAVRTGTAGRPTSKHLALAEMTARHSRGELAPKLAAEARELVERLKEKCEGSPVPTAYSLENSIRTEYRKLKPT